MPIILVIVVAFIAYFFITRSRELFVIRLRGGEYSVVRGSVPSGLMSSFRDALGGVQDATIRASRTPNGARLSTRGLSSSMEQRLRNILGLYPMSHSCPLHPLTSARPRTTS